MMHGSNICLGMLFKTREVTNVRRRDNPPTDALIVAAPPSLPAPSSASLCCSPIHQPAWVEEPHRLLSEMIMKTG